jgi:Uncharacterized conserved protein
MSDDERPVLLLTCSGISHTGQLTTSAGTTLRCRCPVLISRHIQLTALKRPLEQEVSEDEYLVVVDGCGECCAKKRIDAIGKNPDSYIIATQEGIVKRGTEEVRYDEIDTLSQVIIRKIRG